MAGSAQQDGITQVDDIVNDLEEDIALGALYPRERLREDTLMERFGAKRHVVRSALRELVTRGEVIHRPNAGMMVRAYTPQEVRDVYDVRQLLEGHAVEQIPVPLHRAALEQLETLQARHDRAALDKDARGIMHANFAFHDALYDLSGNQALVDAIRLYAQKTYVMRSVTVTTPGHVERSQAEHWDIINALVAGDVTQAARVARQHLLPSRDAYIERITAAGHRPG